MQVTITMNRREALTGADYVIIAFQVGGVEAYANDFDDDAFEKLSRL
jgi:alpha-galactosidase/6-phospho-beta-glucosidase family protein